MSPKKIITGEDKQVVNRQQVSTCRNKNNISNNQQIFFSRQCVYFTITQNLCIDSPCLNFTLAENTLAHCAANFTPHVYLTWDLHYANSKAIRDPFPLLFQYTCTIWWITDTSQFSQYYWASILINKIISKFQHSVYWVNEIVVRLNLPNPDALLRMPDSSVLVEQI